jgi:uncharacterized protein with ParB-like and HNH nuclease domain
MSGFKTPVTIAEAIKNIESNRYLLPSIQREFVWKHNQIEWLFDSIMQNYPISSFLFWNVEGETTRLFKFYNFIREFKQKYKTHNEEFPTYDKPFIAILDGQQRLTSLYIGLRGSYAYRTPRLNEANNERVYPTRRLYLNISEPLQDDEAGKQFEFKFLKNSDFLPDTDEIQSRKCHWTESKGKKICWFKVSDIYALSEERQLYPYFSENKLLDNPFALDTLPKLRAAIHSQPMINFYLEEDQNIDKALNIFIRMNSGGEPLNFSDLIMSMAVAHWREKDARREIHGLVDCIRDKGFSISKDFVLKVFLYLHSKDIKFKVANFSIENAKDFEQEWDKIRDTVLSVFDLVKSFGFTDATLTSKNALIPIVYYLYHRGIEKDFDSRTEYVVDRDGIKRWLHISLVKRVFGNQSDTVLSKIRRVFTENVTENPISSDLISFPVDKMKDTNISDEFIQELLSTEKGDKYAFSLLALLYPSCNYKTNSFDKDHLHPMSLCDDSKHNRQVYNSLKNLQLLDSNENKSKSDKSLDEWVEEKTRANGDRKEFLERHLIPDVSLKLEDFDEFIAARTVILTEKLKSILS